jgi:hypothetical protein
MFFGVIAAPGRSPRTFPLLCRALMLAVVLLLAHTASSSSQNGAAAPPQGDQSDKVYYARAHPYLDEPTKKLCKLVPELKSVHPATDQQALGKILEKTGSNVDEFFKHIVDVIAQERITQERLSGTRVIGEQQTDDNYLIVRESDKSDSDLLEYRMDSNGNRLDPGGYHRGYLVTFGFALLSNYFAPMYQQESVFRYLGDQKLGTRETYVVAFAQKPGEATQFVTMRSTHIEGVHMLMQGIAWIDKANFQIVRMRTDLLAPRPEVSLDRQTTEVTFDPVQLQDISSPLWLPADVKVFLEIKEAVSSGFVQLRFRNEHHYSDYRRYRVSVKMIPGS